MRPSNLKRPLSVVSALLMVAGVALIVAPSASADPGKIPDGPTDFYILGGRIVIGTEIDLPLSHTDRPPECADGIDNESGTTHNGTTGTGSGATVRPYHDLADGQIDFVHPSGGTADPECTNAADNSELIDRALKKTDDLPLCGNGAGQENAGEGGSVRCVSATRLDSYVLPASGTTNNDTVNRFSIIVGDGNATTGQGKEKTRAQAGTVSGNSISVPAANVFFPVGYQAQGQCVGAFGFGQPGWVCLDLYIQFRVLIQNDVAGTTNVNGSGSFGVPIRLNLIAGGSYGTSQKNTIIGRTPRAAECRSNANVTINATSETSGPLTGERYDTVTQNFKVVQDGIAYPTLQQIRANGTALDFCAELNTALGFPAAGQIELIISTASNTNSAGSYDQGTGTAAFPGTHRPVAAMQTGVNGAALSAPSGNHQVINVNEGDLVRIVNTNYDPAKRTLDTDTFARTGGTAAAPPVQKGPNNRDITFVAQNAPSVGNTHIYTGAVEAYLGPIPVGDPGEQRQGDTTTVTVNVANVAPTAIAAPNAVVTGGQAHTLEARSQDPGNPENQRTYCWTQVSGPTVAGLGCGTRDRTVTPANTAGDAVLQLIVNDTHGGFSAPVQTTLSSRPATAGTLSGVVTDSASAGLGAVVVKVYNGSTLAASTATNGSGAWSVNGLGVGPYKVRFSKSGYLTEWFGNTRHATHAIELAAPASNVDAALASTAEEGSVTGTITDAEAATAVSAANVRLYNSVGWVDNAQTNGSGAYSFTNKVKPGNDYRVQFCNGTPGYMMEWSGDKHGPNAGNEAAVYSVAAAGATVVDAGCSPAPSGLGNISGTVTASAGSFAGGQLEARVYRHSDGAFMGRDVLGASGNTFDYSVGDLPPGQYRVWFWDRSGAFYSEWHNDLRGNQFDGTGKIADLTNVTAGGTTVVNETLAP